MKKCYQYILILTVKEYLVQLKLACDLVFETMSVLTKYLLLCIPIYMLVEILIFASISIPYSVKTKKQVTFKYTFNHKHEVNTKNVILEQYAAPAYSTGICRPVNTCPNPAQMGHNYILPTD